MIQLGVKAKDIITGYSGVVIGRCEYISGCNQVLLVPPIGKDGKRDAGEWFDEQRMQVLPGKAIVLNNTLGNGCDIEAPKR